MAEKKIIEIKISVSAHDKMRYGYEETQATKQAFTQQTATKIIRYAEIQFFKCTMRFVSVHSVCADVSMLLFASFAQLTPSWWR